MWRRWRFKRRGPDFGPDAPPNAAHIRARLAIAGCLSGGESSEAWIAVWDLVHDADEGERRDVVVMLREYIDGAVATRGASREATAYFDGAGGVAIADHQWHKIELACDFEAAIIQSLDRARPLRLASPEVRRLHERDQIAAHQRAMENLGVRPGEGLPMWLLYMTRRSKRSWN